MAAKADIFARLQKEILILEGFRPASNEFTDWAGLEPIQSAFPNGTFPTGAVHEFYCEGAPTVSATAAFITGILSTLFKQHGVIIWISPFKMIFPGALTSFGIDPQKVIFIYLKKEKDRLFVMEEALKCDSVTAVIGHIDEISFTESRKFQLAVESSKVTAFLLRQHPRNKITSCATRWQIRPLPSVTEGLPGVGFPKWDVELEKVKNGKPGQWEMQWRAGKFLILAKERFEMEIALQKRKIV
jgi:protein ImuA